MEPAIRVPRLAQGDGDGTTAVARRGHGAGPRAVGGRPHDAPAGPAVVHQPLARAAAPRTGGARTSGRGCSTGTVLVNSGQKAPSHAGRIAPTAGESGDRTAFL